MTLILGIDPGSRVTGYGLVAMEKNKSVHVDSGCLDMAELALDGRLRVIFAGLTAVIREHRPDEVAIEKIFMSRNADSAIKLGQARGVAIVAAAMCDVPVYEYSPNEIKLAVVGRGHATKDQVQHMVKVLLTLQGALRADASDALAVAICHGHTRQTLAMVAGAHGARAGRWL
jgi:crossover junction endodeoxyribonuclease RuvC